VDVGTELKLMFAAFDLVNLVSWEVHTAWTNKLYRALMSEPPPGFGNVSLTQILRADQELFTVLAAEFQQPLKAATVGAKPPLDDEIKKCMMDPRINVFLAPLPKSEHRAAIDPPIKNKFEKKPLQPKLDNNKVSPQVPAELQGLHLKTKDNKPLCWHRNLQKGCSNQVKKGRCKFGYHFCMKCLKPGHGAFECKN